MHKLLSIIVVALLLLMLTSKAEAAGCTIVYGGGEIACAKKTVTPTPAPVTQVAQNQTKGGLPVYNSTPSATTPNTGPEALSLFGLIPMALGGFWLRKKVK